MKSAYFFAQILLSFTLAWNASAAAKPSPKAAEEPKWYLVSAAGKPLGYYVETVGPGSNKDLQLSSQKTVLLGSSPANVQIETVTTSDDFLTPVSFDLHFRRRDGTRELKLSGLRQRKGIERQMELTLEKIKPTPSKETKVFPYPQGAIFYTSLPRYLARKKPGLYVVKAIIEDVRELDLVTRPLKITRTSEHKTVSGQECDRSYVDFGGESVNDMWVNKDGQICDSQVSDTKATIQPSSESELKKLDPPPANSANK